MTPNEIFALKSESIEPWNDLDPELLGFVFEISDLPYDFDIEAEDTELTCHTKLDYNEDGERGVVISAMYFQDRPFALICRGGRGLRDSQDVFVTDRDLWFQARAYLHSILNRLKDAPRTEVNPDEDIVDGYYNAAIVKHDGEVRLVSGNEVHPIAGTLVYDEKKYREVFDRKVRPLADKVGIADCIQNPEVRAAALEAFRAGIVGEVVELEIPGEHGELVIAASASEGQTFLHQVRLRGMYMSWARTSQCVMVGPDSMLDCYREYVRTGRVSAASKYVQDISGVMGVDPEMVAELATSFVASPSIYGHSMVERILMNQPRPEWVDENTDANTLTHYLICQKVLESPGFMRYLRNAYPYPKHADEFVNACNLKEKEEAYKAAAALKP